MKMLSVVAVLCSCVQETKAVGFMAEEFMFVRHRRQKAPQPAAKPVPATLPQAMLKMRFECDIESQSRAQTKVHGLFMLDKSMEEDHRLPRNMQKNAEFGHHVAWNEFNSQNMWDANDAGWLCRGFDKELNMHRNNPKDHLKHEWEKHGQYIVYYLDGVGNPATGNRVARYLELMKAFDAAPNNVQHWKRQQALQCGNPQHPIGHYKYFELCGKLTGDGSLTFNYQECPNP